MYYEIAISYHSFISGGLKAVIYTDTLQTVIMVAGSIVLMGLSMQHLYHIIIACRNILTWLQNILYITDDF